MASNSFIKKSFFLFVSCFAIIKIAIANDPDILTDFVVPDNKTNDIIDGTFFTYTGMRVVFENSPPPTLKVLRLTMVEFPALDGQSITYNVVQLPANATNPLHVHPRASELLFILKGTIQAGFVDTTNKLYTQTLQEGDMFAIPKGLVHFQYNPDSKNPALILAAFPSANPGISLVSKSVFTAGIDDNILAQSFKTDVATIQKIKAGLAPKPL